MSFRIVIKSVPIGYVFPGVTLPIETFAVISSVVRGNPSFPSNTSICLVRVVPSSAVH